MSVFNKRKQTFTPIKESLPSYEESILRKTLLHFENKRTRYDLQPVHTDPQSVQNLPLCIDLEPPASPVMVFETKFDHTCSENTHTKTLFSNDIPQAQLVLPFTRHQTVGLTEPSYCLVWFFITVQRTQELELNVSLSVYEERVLNTTVAASNTGHFRSTHKTCIETVKQKDAYLHLDSVIPLKHEQQSLCAGAPASVLKDCYKAFLLVVDQHIPGCIVFGKNLFMTRTDVFDMNKLLSEFVYTLNKEYSFTVFDNTNLPAQNDNSPPLSENEIEKLEKWLMSDDFALTMPFLNNSTEQQQDTLIVFDYDSSTNKHI